MEIASCKGLWEKVGWCALVVEAEGDGQRLRGRGNIKKEMRKRRPPFPNNVNHIYAFMCVYAYFN